jgi:RND superfamily putative drug exporter
MSLLLYRLGLFSARRWKLVIAVWVVGVIAFVALSQIAGDETSDNLTLPGTDSTAATDLLSEKLPQQENGTVPIVFESKSGRLDDSANSKVVKETVSSLLKAPHVADAVSPLSAEGADQLSKDGRIAYISLTLDIGSSDLDADEANAVIEAADPATRAGFQVAAGGYLGKEVSKPSTHVSELIGIIAAIIILLIAFGTAVAMSLPILTAIIGLSIGLSVIGLLGHAMTIPTIAPTLGTMIGLGVGIDYALFIVTRYRTRAADGLTRDEAIARSCATSGSAVTFAGGTVVIALCSLAFANIPIVSALGYSAAVVVLIAVLGAITLLPAILGALGPRIESLKVPFHSGAHHEDDHPRGWARWAEGVADRPWPAMVLAVAILVALAIPLKDMRLGQQDIGALPTDTTARQAYDLISEGFGAGTNGPFLVAVSLDPPAKPDTKKLDQLNEKENKQQQQIEQQSETKAQQQAQAQIPGRTQQLIAQGVPPDEAQAEATQQAQADATKEAKKDAAAQQPSNKKQQQVADQKKFLKSTASDPRLTKLRNKIGKDKGVDTISLPAVSKSGSAAVFSAYPNTAPSAEATETTIRRLRDSVIPAAVESGVRADVGGTTASYIDLADRISDRLVTVIAIVVALSFFLLMLAFRSIVVPITAGLMNLLSVAASYGVLVAVFEKGFGLSVIGLDNTIPIVSFVPLLMFAVLFGLSMDYQVFLVSRIGEVYRDKDDNRIAVIHGLASSARVITSAALIMVSVFTSFVLNGDPTVKQFGVGLAVAIAVDATIVRCLLVPAAMVLLGRSNWWFPGWLERHVPAIGLESEDSLPEPAMAGGAPPPEATPRAPEPAPPAPEPAPEPTPPGPEPPAPAPPEPEPEPEKPAQTG